VLTRASNCNVKYDSEPIIGFLESIVSGIIPQKLLQYSNIQDSTLPASPSHPPKQSLWLVIGKYFKIKNSFIKHFLSSVSSYYWSNYATSWTASYDFRHTVWLYQGLNYSDMIHSHHATTRKKKSTTTYCMPDLSKKLHLFILWNIRTHDHLQPCLKFLLVFLY